MTFTIKGQPTVSKYLALSVAELRSALRGVPGEMPLHVKVWVYHNGVVITNPTTPAWIDESEGE